MEYTGNEGQSEYCYQDGFGDAELTVREYGLTVAKSRLQSHVGSFGWEAYRKGFSDAITAFEIVN